MTAKGTGEGMLSGGGFAFPRSCAVNEETGDGVPVGRCMFFVGDNDQCPRHGDVGEVMRRYRETGKLTREREFRAGKGR